eukprot:7320360-Prymnesium_polylepis.1
MCIRDRVVRAWKTINSPPTSRFGAQGCIGMNHTGLLSHETVGWCHPFSRVIVGATASRSRLQ